jgi:hypothetical protein
MRALIKGICLTLLLTAPALPAFPHHSVYGNFDVKKLDKIRGEFRNAELVNPHGWFHFYELDASGARVQKNGAPVVWSLETPGPSMLRRMGITEKLFQVGSAYTIYLSPQLGGDTKGLMDITVFPDGKVLVIGNKSDPRYQPVLAELGKKL